MTTILLARHGETDWNKNNYFSGRANIELNEKGQRQAQMLGRYIGSHWQPSTLYTSPFDRAINTGKYIADTFELQSQQLPLLVDIDYGIWQAKLHKEFREKHPDQWLMWLEHPERYVFEDGESLQDVQVRARNIIQKIEKSHESETVVLIGHDCVNRLLMLEFLGLPLSAYRKVIQGNGCLNVVKIVNGAYVIVSMNERAFLGEYRF
ncbi:histidine phosphatase family protein [Sediminitomix flava]|uniref:Putative phosphoglycerate mutase n=1 Tax=Sediminitomix flava TaxID=379075 RepID=A0A315ZFR6_SEDFL|nr:histidine phosphatase family protein [Sediminitomix flava]PWJ44152.1 putative phosphoglycerate mutase [Sediminitomix flava]